VQSSRPKGGKVRGFKEEKQGKRTRKRNKLLRPRGRGSKIFERVLILIRGKGRGDKTTIYTKILHGAVYPFEKTAQEGSLWILTGIWFPTYVKGAP